MKALARLHLSALGVALTLAATPAYAQSQGMLDNVLNKYKSMAAAWASVFTTHATILFGTLAAVSLIWTFGVMALRRADLGEFASEAIRFAIFCGFFWWLLINGPAIGLAIIEGLRSLGAQASGLPNNLAPSGIVDIGFDIFRQAVEASSVLTPVESVFILTADSRSASRRTGRVPLAGRGLLPDRAVVQRRVLNFLSQDFHQCMQARGD